MVTWYYRGVVLYLLKQAVYACVCNLYIQLMGTTRARSRKRFFCAPK